MLPSPALADALRHAPAQRHDAALYRAVHLRHILSRSPPEPLFFLSSSRGARYTPPGGPAALYMADAMETAFAEANHLALGPAGLGVPPPTVIVCARTRLAAVLDLFLEEVRDLLQTDPVELAASWRDAPPGEPSPTQRLGRLAWESGRFAAIRYPSVRFGGRPCYAIFPDRLLLPLSFVEINDSASGLIQRIPPV